MRAINSIAASSSGLQLDSHFGEHHFNHFRKALEYIDAGNEDFGHAPVSSLRVRHKRAQFSTLLSRTQKRVAMVESVSVRASCCSACARCPTLGCVWWMPSLSKVRCCASSNYRQAMMTLSASVNHVAIGNEKYKST